MKGSTSLRRRIGVAALALIGTSAAIGLPALPASAFTVPPQHYGGYGSGVETFADLTPTARLLKAQIASGRSANDSQGLKAVSDELGNVVSGPDASKASIAHGDALSLKALNTPIQLVAPANADAPPSSTQGPNTLVNLPVSTIASVAAVRDIATARFNEAGAVCILGADLANGLGETADARLLGATAPPAGLTNPTIATQTGGNNVVSSNSRQLLTAQVGRNGTVLGTKVGVESEVIQTVAPVAINAAGALVLSIEVAGVFQLRAHAGGIPGTGFVEYNPQTGAQAPVLRLNFPPGGPISTVLNPLLGALSPALLGLVQPSPGQILVPLNGVTNLLQPVFNLLASLGIVVGEAPRAIFPATGAPLERADGTAAAGAIDLVRIRPTGALAALQGIIGDIRVGHMEVAAFAPAGGIDCPGLDVKKTTDRDPVQVGETFTYTITAINPYDCTLTNVRVQDDITGTNGVTFTLGTTTPPGATVTNIANGKRVEFTNIGNIPPRGSRQVLVPITVNSSSTAGRISDTATVTASCATGGGSGTTKVNLDLTGKVTLNAPKVGGTSVAGLARTGRNDGIYLALGLSLVLGLAGVEYLRRRSAGLRS